MAQKGNAFAFLGSDSDDEENTAPAQVAAPAADKPAKAGDKKAAASEKKVTPAGDQSKKVPANANKEKANAVAPKAVPAGAKKGGDAKEPVAVDGADVKSLNTRHGGHPGRDRPTAGGDPSGRRGGNKREHDRHSGTGRGKEVAKDGAGSHNWGTYEADEGVAAAEPAAEGADAAAAPAAVEEAKPVVVEEPDNTKTLAQYEEERLAKRSGAAFAEKKEKSVQTKIEGVLKEKKEEILSGLGQENLEEKKEKAAKEKREARAGLKRMDGVDIQVKREQPASDFGGRGGRGGFRGGRGGGFGGRPGGDRRSNQRFGSNGQKSEPNVSDETAFPTLKIN